METQKLIEEIRELTAHLKKQASRIKSVEELEGRDLDTLLSVSGELYEKIAILKYLQGGYDHNSLGDPEEEGEDVSPAIPPVEKKASPKPQPEGYGLLEPTTPAPTAVKEDPGPEEAEEITETPPQRAAKGHDLFSMMAVEENPGPEKEPKKPAILHEKISREPRKDTLSGQLGAKPIRDLKEAIGIHEQFLFINELFGGNMQEYNQSLDSLKDLQSRESAYSFLKPFKEKYRWAGKESAEKFFSLVDRKFQV